MKILKNSLIQPGELAVVVGSGASGVGAARLLHLAGAKVRVLDKNSAFSAEFKGEAKACGFELCGGEHRSEQFFGATLVVPSPGVPISVLEALLEPLRQAGQNSGACPRWVSELELAARCATEPVLAITGTSGKTTTTSIAAAMLEENGKKVFLGGNIGTPLSEYIVRREKGGERAAVLVLEVSSFQLQGTQDFHPQVGVLLNLSENHLDQHKDMAEYREAKFRLFKNQTEKDLAVFGADLADELVKRKLKAKIEYFRATGNFTQSHLLGQHNMLNLEAAFLAVRPFGVSLDTARRAAAKFAPLPNRLESVASINDVLYVNDSKCTTVEALSVALQAFEKPVLLLAGGVFKGGDLPSLIPLLKKSVKAVGLYGANREIFEKAWPNSVPMSWDASMSEAFARLQKEARPGDVLLLAPATSSFDQYANYKERGADFRKQVEKLKGKYNA
jgi:UDP-N-acetylmuramoylalanine--D-glutamate ligase